MVLRLEASLHCLLADSRAVFQKKRDSQGHGCCTLHEACMLDEHLCVQQKPQPCLLHKCRKGVLCDQITVQPDLVKAFVQGATLC